MSWRRGFSLTSLAALGLLACQVIVGVGDETGEPRPGDGGTDTVDAGEEPDPCLKHHPPLPPSTTTAETPGARFFAVKTFRLRPRDALPIGYDLDDRCTGTAGSTTSAAPCTSPNEGDPVVDDDGGVDNSFGRLLDTVRLVNPADDLAGEAFTTSAERGIFTFIVQVLGWNGEPNDERVSVAMITGTNLASSGCGDAAVPGGRPRFDGCDRWDFSEDTPFTPEFGVAANGMDGYVTNGVLVATDRKTPRSFGFGETTVTLHEPLLTARIVDDAGVPTLVDGVVTGRVAASTLLEFVYRLERDGGAFCDDPNTTALVRQFVCDRRDITLSRSDDGKGLGCDAVSFAFGFDAPASFLGSPRSEPVKTCSGPLDTTCP